jgi:thiosulfate dehydrogenase (quinone) large subunit
MCSAGAVTVNGVESRAGIDPGGGMTAQTTALTTDDPLAASRLSRALVAVLRIGVAILWINNLSWKNPPSFGQGERPSGLYEFTRWAVDHPVFRPYAWIVEHLVLPNFKVFAWGVLLIEAALGAFLLIGLATRFFALLGIAQSLAITFSVANAPNEWLWSYLLMLLAHAAIFATAAGRYGGLDGVLRPLWRRSVGRPARLMVAAS